MLTTLPEPTVETAGPGLPFGQHPLSDHYRSLVAQLRGPGDDSPLSAQAVGFTACSRGEGVSTVAANVAIAAALSDRSKVVLVDANFEHPSVAGSLAVPSRPGLAEALGGAVELSACLHRWRVDNLLILPAGQAAAASRAGVTSEDCAAFLQELKRRARLIIFDLPTADNACGGAFPIDRLDGVVLVVQAQHVRTYVARQVRQRLLRAGARLVGATFNKRPEYIPEWLYRAL